MNQKLRAMMERDPFAQSLGIELTELEPGLAKAKMTLGPAALNFFGYVHGGAVFSLMDYVFSAASNSHNEMAVAVSMSVQFLHAADPAGVLWAEAREIDKSRKLGLYELTVRDESGRLICRSDGRVYRIGKAIVEE
jgi:acyl-CoA thioesterase